MTSPELTANRAGKSSKDWSSLLRSDSQSFVKSLSWIPVLGLLTCFYLMTQLGITNWSRFLIWLAVGLVIYFLYGRKASKLNRVLETE